MRKENNLETFAPLIGGLVAGVGATAFAAHFPIRPEALALGIGAVGMGIASQTKGIAQRAALGFAAAGASMLAIEIVRRLRPKWQPEPLPQRQAASGDLITRKELAEILGRNNHAQPVDTKPVVEPLPARPSNDNAPARTAPRAAPAAPVTIAPEHVPHFAAIYARLTAEERVRVSSLMASAQPSLLAKVQRDLLSMTPDRAVEHLRRNVFRAGVVA